MVEGSGRVRFRVLGSLQVETVDGIVEVPGRKPRVLLAVLLAHANRYIDSVRLADLVWNGHPPDGAPTTLRGYVLTVRRSLAAQGRDRLTAGSGGYRLRVEPGELDSAVFTDLIERARNRRAAGSLEFADRTLADALALWRGPAFADLPNGWLHDVEGARLEALRLEARVARVDIALASRRQEDVLAELQELVAAHPLNEGIAARCMHALHGAGRQAEALRVYRDVRARLVEAGLAPTPRLEAAQAAVLRGSADGQGVAVAARERRRPVPACELPPVVPDFVGRGEALRDAQRFLLAAHPDPRPHPRLIAVTGPAGIGTTSFAVELAHRVKHAYPDGQLYVPAGAWEAHDRRRRILRRSLDALGVPVGYSGADHAELERVYRSVTAGRRLLLLLDGSPDAAATLPLLPTSASSAVIVTSEEGRGGWDGAHHVRLGGLSVAAGSALLGALLREDVARGDALLTRLVLWSDGLPCALRAAAAWIRNRADRKEALSDLVARLESAEPRLRRSALDDLGLLPAMQASLARCTSAERRLLGVLAAAGFDVDVADAALLLAARAPVAAEALHGLWHRGLVRCNLQGGGRFRVVGPAAAYAAASDLAQHDDRRRPLPGPPNGTVSQAYAPTGTG